MVDKKITAKVKLARYEQKHGVPLTIEEEYSILTEIKRNPIVYIRHLHDLRHTFIARAQECGIRREIVSLWAEHKADSSITTNVYTHFQERSELQIKEMQKYNYEYDF